MAGSINYLFLCGISMLKIKSSYAPCFLNFYLPVAAISVLTSSGNCGGVIFSLQFVCLCLRLSVCLFVDEQKLNRTDALIGL